MARLGSASAGYNRELISKSIEIPIQFSSLSSFLEFTLYVILLLRRQKILNFPPLDPRDLGIGR